ncbi:MAG: ATP-binding cassette domain-containing protein [Ectothiorhodospiraceae bacterium]|nr:ATP-binding cassette domain-containing protein [Ectothiorhodospiraceae bacterium]
MNKDNTNSATPHSSTLINVEQLTRYYDGEKSSDVSNGQRKAAVDNISFEVRRGEVLGFLGPNGAGKSTTMRMITGNLAPSHGRIFINGIDILDHPKRAKAHIGFLPEQPPVYRELSVDEYLQFCARINRIPRHKQATAVETAKQRCGLTDVNRRLIGNLSKGYQQRVGIAQAIIHLPAVVVLDEPTVGLDPIQIREIRHLIRDLSQDHGIILSTHILSEVQATCDRVQIINQGRLILNDSIDGLTRHMQTSRLLLRTTNAANIEILRRIDGVEAVNVLAEGGCLIQHYPETNPAPAIAQATVEHQWQLLELSPQRRSLEDIFVDITTNEPPGETHAEAHSAGAHKETPQKNPNNTINTNNTTQGVNI